jgi:hypothetical protein
MKTTFEHNSPSSPTYKIMSPTQERLISVGIVSYFAIFFFSGPAICGGQVESALRFKDTIYDANITCSDTNCYHDLYSARRVSRTLLESSIVAVICVCLLDLFVVCSAVLICLHCVDWKFPVVSSIAFVTVMFAVASIQISILAELSTSEFYNGHNLPLNVSQERDFLFKTAIALTVYCLPPFIIALCAVIYACGRSG